MSDDPVRWNDGGDAPEHVRELVREARAIPPMPPETRSALAAQLGQIVPPQVTPLQASPTVWAVTGLVALGAAAVIASSLGGTSSERRPPPAATPSTPSTPSASAFHPTLAPAESAESSLPASPSSAPASASSAQRPQARQAESGAAHEGERRGGAAQAQDTLSVESALVGRARGHLGSDPSLSLAAVDEHARRFPRGELSPEREYLRVSALRRLGRSAEAKQRARSYLVTFPSSPYVASVRSMLLELEGP